jgi:hypothetical protein
MIHAIDLYLPFGQSSIFFDALSQSVERKTPAGSHLTRRTLHEKRRHIFTTMLADSRSMDETLPFVVAIAVIKQRLINTLRSCWSGGVSVFVLRASWRACIDGDESIF